MAFITTTPLPSSGARPRALCHANKRSNSNSTTTTTTAVADDVVETYFPAYQRNRAPTIVVTGEQSVSVSMEPVKAFQTVDNNVAPLLDYSDPDAFVPDKPVPPSPISWPSGDGRSDPDFKGVRARFDQPNLKNYGPFPDFFKRSCDG